MKAALLLAITLSFMTSQALSQEKTVKVYDSAFERAQCPEGYEDVGRFVEAKGFDKGKRRAGVECKISNKPKDKKNQGNKAPQKPKVNPKDGPDSLEVVDEDGKKASCPEGYAQTGTFSNFQFSEGRASSRSGVYCSKIVAPSQPSDQL